MKLNTYVFTLTAAGILCTGVAADPPVTGNPAAAGDGVQVGVGKRDGITVTGNEAYVTRNGATEKLSKDLVLPSGVIARPNGTIILPDKTEATLRPSQLLTFNGEVVEIPLDPRVNPPAPPSADSNAGNPSGGTSGSGNVRNPNASGGAGKRGPNQQNQNGGGATGGFSNGSTGNDVGINGNGLNQNLRTFVGRDGVQFTGTIGQDGSITTSDGRSIVNDGTVRTVTFDQNGNAMFGAVSRNGTIVGSDGTVTAQDGTTRTADGRIIASPNGVTNGNVNTLPPNNPGATGAGVPAASGGPGGNSPNNAGTVNRGNTSGTANSPNNAGTVNVGNSRDGGNSPNNAGTVNNPAAPGANGQGAQGGANQAGTETNNGTTGNRSNVQSTGGARSGGSSPAGGARNGGSSSGPSGSGASGAGGASGGGGGGASR